MLEDEPGEQRLLKRESQKDQDTCIDDRNNILGPSSGTCQCILAAVLIGMLRTSSPSDLR